MAPRTPVAVRLPALASDPHNILRTRYALHVLVYHGGAHGHTGAPGYSVIGNAHFNVYGSEAARAKQAVAVMRTLQDLAAAAVVDVSLLVLAGDFNTDADTTHDDVVRALHDGQFDAGPVLHTWLAACALTAGPIRLPDHQADYVCVWRRAPRGETLHPPPSWRVIDDAAALLLSDHCAISCTIPLAPRTDSCAS